MMSFLNFTVNGDNENTHVGECRRLEKGDCGEIRGKPVTSFAYMVLLRSRSKFKSA